MLQKTYRAAFERLLASGLIEKAAFVLAAAGEFALVCDVVWPVCDARTLATDWLERAIAAGGAQGSIALVRALGVMPEETDRFWVQPVDLHAQADADGAHKRTAIMRELQKTDALAREMDSVQALGALNVRALTCDRAVNLNRLSRRRTETLALKCGANVFSSDLPIFGEPATVVWADVNLPASEAGARAPRDAGATPDGRVWVALGEAGVEMRSREGQIVHLFDAPAGHLVIADSGLRAIALAPGQTHARQSLATRHPFFYCDRRPANHCLGAAFQWRGMACRRRQAIVGPRYSWQSAGRAVADSRHRLGYCRLNSRARCIVCIGTKF